MSLWFAGASAREEPFSSRRKAVVPACRAIDTSRVVSCPQNAETATVYPPAGKRQFQAYLLPAADTALYNPPNRATFVVSPFENCSKKIIPEFKPVEKEKVIHTKPRVPAPFATDAVEHHATPSRLTFTAANGNSSLLQQKRHFGADGSSAPLTPRGATSTESFLAHNEVTIPPPLPKRSRTPPVGTKLRCDSEAFCVLYNTRPGASNRSLEMRLVPSEKHGKTCMRYDDYVAQKRDEADQMRDHSRKLKCDAARQRQNVEPPSPRATGKRRCAAGVDPSASAVAAGNREPPFAINLPTGRFDDVGRSTLSARRERGALDSGRRAVNMPVTKTTLYGPTATRPATTA